MSLYTTYRPRDWDSVIGQDSITTILRNSLRSDRVSHAYLFHGSRGTGKTTSARILAKAVNCLDLRDGNPCHTCIHCQAFDNGTMLDVIEIDAASNTGVDNIRELIEKARFEPSQGSYKIYIIDEVHMLSTGAFNALLKTLEEPPKHVKFILATTEIEKVPETIRSRALRFDFRKIGMTDMITRMTYVCQEEKIEYDDEALSLIAKSAKGGLRDALTLLEQNTIDHTLSADYIRRTLSLLEDDLIDEIISTLGRQDAPQILKITENLRERHVQARAFFEQLIYRLRDLMVEHIDTEAFFTYTHILETMQTAYAQIRNIPDGMILIELTLLKLTRGEQALTTTTPEKKPLPIEKDKVLPARKEEKPNLLHTPGETLPQEEKKPSLPKDTPAEKIHFSYPNLLSGLKKTHPALTVDLKTARFQHQSSSTGETLTLIFPQRWNYDRVNTLTIKNTITEALTELFSGEWTLMCELSEASGGLSHAVDEVF